jgi:hypothetical protein
LTNARVSSPFRLAPWTAAGVFALLLVRPLGIAGLRAAAQRRDPDGWSRLSTNGSFTLLVPEAMTTRYHDEANYAARVHQILLHGVPSDPYWRDDRGAASWLPDCLALYLMAAPAALFGGNLTAAWIFAVAAVGTLWFLLFYRALRRWCGRDDVAVPLALFLTVFPDLTIWLLDVNFSLAQNWERYASVFFERRAETGPIFHRLPPHFLSSLLLYGLLVQLWRLTASPRRRTVAAAALGLGFGLMALVQAFEFSFGMAALGLFAASLWPPRQDEDARWNATVALGAACAASAAYVLLTARVLDAATRLEMLDLLGLVRTHRFYLVTVVHLLAAGAGLLLARREKAPERKLAWRLLACAQAAVFCCRNAQVLTGFSVQPYHYIPFGSFIGCAMVLLWASDALSRGTRWSARAGTAAVVALFAWGLANELTAAAETYRFFGLPRDVESGLDWVRKSLPRDALILSPSMEVNETVPLYTAATVQVPPASPSPTSGPYTSEIYFYHVAQLLKSGGLDPARFLNERWLLMPERDRVVAKMHADHIALHRFDVADFERAEWFYPMWYGASDDARVRAGRARIKALAAEVPGVAAPFYLWINARDRDLLSAPPESRGGRLVYENQSVRVYEFAREPENG